VKDAARLNGLTSLCVTKLDVLTGLKTLKIGVAYELGRKRVESMPASLKGLSDAFLSMRSFQGARRHRFRQEVE